MKIKKLIEDVSTYIISIIFLIIFSPLGSVILIKELFLGE